MTKRAGMVVAVVVASVTSGALAQQAQTAFTAKPAATAAPAPARPLSAAEKRRLVDYMPAERIADKAAFFATRTAANAAKDWGTTVHMSADEENAWILVHRETDSDIERHARWDDFVMVRAGKGAIVIAKDAKGARRLATGEWRGGTLVSEYRMSVKAGDMVRIPAGVPHAFVVDSGVTFDYLVMKIHRPELKIRD